MILKLVFVSLHSSIPVNLLAEHKDIHMNSTVCKQTKILQVFTWWTVFNLILKLQLHSNHLIDLNHTLIEKLHDILYNDGNPSPVSLPHYGKDMLNLFLKSE